MWNGEAHDAARKIVIVGGRTRGVGRRWRARAQDAAAEVILINDESASPTRSRRCRRPCSPARRCPPNAPIAGPKGIAGADVTLRSGTRVVAIDRDAARCRDRADERIRYDALVLATGSRNRVLPLFPVGRKGIYYCAPRRRRARSRRSAPEAILLVIGGGLIGLEVAASAAELGMRSP